MMLMCVCNVLQNEIIQRVSHNEYFLKLSLSKEMFVRVQNSISFNFRQCFF